MSTVESILGKGAAKESGREIRAKLAEYMSQQPAAKQAFHKWMRVVEWAGMAVAVAWFGLAVYVSINHADFGGRTIAAAWFALPVSVVPLIILAGLHSAVLRASVPTLLTGKPQRFVTGVRAVRAGWTQIAIALAAGAFWGILAWAVWSFDVALIGGYARILGTTLGVVIPAAIVLGMVGAIYRQFVRSR